MRIARLTACATRALLLDTVIYNHNLVLQFLPTSQVLEITIENKGFCKQASPNLPDAGIYHRKCMLRRVHQPPRML